MTTLYHTVFERYLEFLRLKAFGKIRFGLA